MKLIACTVSAIMEKSVVRHKCVLLSIANKKLLLRDSVVRYVQTRAQIVIYSVLMATNKMHQVKRFVSAMSVPSLANYFVPLDQPEKMMDVNCANVNLILFI